MSNLYEIGTENNNVGIDLDNQTFNIGGSNYGTYDVVRRPIITGASDNYIIPENKDYGLPTRQSNGNYGMNSFYDENQGLNEPIADDMTLNINNGRVRNITDVRKTNLNNNNNFTMFRDNQETAVKGLLEETELSNVFFSDENIKSLQMSIRYGVNQRTKQVISNQSEKELYIIMRSIMLQYANFQSGFSKVIGEVKRLNDKVLEYCVDNVSSNVLQHLTYIDDINNLPQLIDRPQYLNKDNYTYDLSNIIQ